MYSETALAVYSEMLKTAEADLVQSGTTKLAWNPLNLFRGGGAAAAKAAVSPAEAVAQRALLRSGFASQSDRAAEIGKRLALRQDNRLISRLSGNQNPQALADAMTALKARPGTSQEYINSVLSGNAKYTKNSVKDLAAQRASVKSRAGVPAAKPKPASVPSAAGANGAAAPAETAAGGGMGFGTKALLGAGGLGLGAGAYGLGRYQQGQEDKTQRNMAFGGGVAAGMAAPHLLRGIGNVANNAASNPFFAASQFQG